MYTHIYMIHDVNCLGVPERIFMCCSWRVTTFIRYIFAQIEFWLNSHNPWRTFRKIQSTQMFLYFNCDLLSISSDECCPFEIQMELFVKSPIFKLINLRKHPENETHPSEIYPLKRRCLFCILFTQSALHRVVA